MLFQSGHFTQSHLMKPGSLVRFFFHLGKPKHNEIQIDVTRSTFSVYGEFNPYYERFDEASYRKLSMFVFLEKIELLEARKKYKKSNFFNPNLPNGEYLVCYSMKKQKIVFTYVNDTLIETIQD